MGETAEENSEFVRNSLNGNTPAADWCREHGYTAESITAEANLVFLAKFATTAEVNRLFREITKNA